MNGIRRRAATLVAASSLVLLFLLALPAGAAANMPVPAAGGIMGTVIGADHGTLAGGVVRACPAIGRACLSATIDSNQTYLFTSVPGGPYALLITPPSYGSRYLTGWYSAWSPGNFTTDGGSATFVAGGAIVPPIVVPVRAPTSGSVFGRVVGVGPGDLAGGTVTACGLQAACRSTLILRDGSFAIGGLVPDRYRVAIAPPPFSPYPSGWYSAWSAGSFTTNPASATLVWVGDGAVGLGTIVVAAPIALRGSISGSTIGSDGGSLAGGSVLACPPVGLCIRRTIDWDGTWLVSGLPSGSYVVAVAPPAGAPYLSGFYSSWSPGNFNVLQANATVVTVVSWNVPLPRIIVPRTLGPGSTTVAPAVAPAPAAPAGATTVAGPVALTSWIRAAATPQVRSTVAVPAGAKVELVARTETYYAGRTVEVWRRAGSGAWARVASRPVAADGTVTYRFAATGDAAYRLRMPASATAPEAVGLVRTVWVR